MGTTVRKLTAQINRAMPVAASMGRPKISVRASTAATSMFDDRRVDPNNFSTVSELTAKACAAAAYMLADAMLAERAKKKATP